MQRLVSLTVLLFCLCLGAASAYNCTPGCLNGICEAYLGNLSCNCLDNWFGETCSQFICEKDNPCLNDGVCAFHPNITSQYVCACPLGFTGARCQYQYPGGNCSSNPCGVNGTCFEATDRASGFYCDCNLGSYGQTCNFTQNACINNDGTDFCNGRGRCEVIANKDGQPIASCDCYNPLYRSDIPPYMCGNVLKVRNFCIPQHNPCVSGECLPTFELPNYKCICPPNKQGVNCTQPFDVCTSELRCLNSGTCNPENHYFNCTCPPNYTGEHCEFIIDPCTLSPCQNEGRCIVDSSPQPNGYYLFGTETHCECVCGHSGADCNTSLSSTPLTSTCSTSVDLCTPNPCSNDGMCTADESSLGFSCTCPEGYFGVTCNQVNHCGTSPCGRHTLDCVNGDVKPFCVCSEGWAGETCEQDINECSISPCNDGNCTNTLGTFVCVCPPGKTGSRCELVLDCSRLECVNGGVCQTERFSECVCKDGYTGDQCQTEACPNEDCTVLAGNRECDEKCFRVSCGFDGGDCYARPNVTFTDPWTNCTQASLCKPVYKNGQCNVDCNTAECLYDGLDCVPSVDRLCPLPESCEGVVGDGVCSSDCYTTDCPYGVDCRDNYAEDILVIVILANREEPFESPWKDRFIEDLNRLTNSIAAVINTTLLTRQELADMKRPLILFPPQRLQEDVLIYRLEIKLDLKFCDNQCPASAYNAANWIQAEISSGGGTIGPYRVADAYVIPDQPKVTTPQWPFAIVVVGIVLAVLVVGVVVVIGMKRKRGNGGQESSTARKIRAFIWRPESPASDTSNSRPSPTSDRRRPSESQAATSLVSKDGTPAPPADPEFIANGSTKAKMEPTTGQTHIKWNDVHIPLINTPTDPSPQEQSSVIVGQLGNDKRHWTQAHCEVLKDPHHIRRLLDEYRKKNGTTDNVNAPGPSGFTPLMLLIMKRHSNHESIIYNSRGSSESGSDHNDLTALLPSRYLNSGRPTSNSSVFSHDVPYYATSSQVLPIDSSVSALLEAKVNLDAVNDYGQSALHLACACSRGDYVEQLLEAGANPCIQDNWGQSALQAAIVAAAEGAFMILLNHSRTDLNLKSDGGVTPLIAAVKVVNQFMVKQLLKKNVDIGATDSDGRTAVHWAAMVDNLDALKLLIRQGPDAVKDAQDHKGQTALFLACREGSASCVKHLLDCFANATLLDNLDQSPIQIAYHKQHMDLVDMLRATAQGPFPMHSQMPHMRGIPNMSGAFSHFQEQDSGQYCHQQLVHPRKSKQQKHIKPNQHTHSSTLDSMGVAGVHTTPTFISNVHSDQSYFGLPLPAHVSDNHQTFGDLRMSSSAHVPQQSSAPNGGIPMTNFAPPQTSCYDPTTMSGPVRHARLPQTSSEYIMKKSPPDIHSTHPVSSGYHLSDMPHHIHPITPPDSATLVKVQTPTYSSKSPNTHVDQSKTITVSSATGFEEIQAVTDLITSIADNPPARSATLNNYSYSDRTAPVYPETSVGGSMRLQHLPLATESKLQYPPGSSAPGLVSDPLSLYHHGGNQTSPPQINSVGSGSGSPPAMYPSPPYSNEFNQTSFNAYQYPASSYATNSPPSLTPSPESREEAVARQQLRHEIMTESYGTILPVMEGEHGVVHHHYHHGYPPLESSV